MTRASDLDNRRSREWRPALEAANVKRRRILDLRHTGISNWLASGMNSHEVARYGGSSLTMIERMPLGVGGVAADHPSW
jgi:hypothetical protein